MSCQKCNSNRVLSFGAKCSDMFNASIAGHDYDGYVLSQFGIGRGDYIDAAVCLDCGQMQGQFPREESWVEKGWKDEDGPDEDEEDQPLSGQDLIDNQEDERRFKAALIRRTRL